ncbi:MAG: hypothetical protein AB7P20_00705 [Rhizobiaceae bacterium]
MRSKISIVERTGRQSFIVMNTAPEIMVATSERVELPNGAPVHLCIDPHRVYLFHRDSGLILSH